MESMLHIDTTLKEVMVLWGDTDKRKLQYIVVSTTKEKELCVTVLFSCV